MCCWYAVIDWARVIERAEKRAAWIVTVVIWEGIILVGVGRWLCVDDRMEGTGRYGGRGGEVETRDAWF